MTYYVHEFLAYGFGGNSLRCRPAVTYFTIPPHEGVEEDLKPSPVVTITPVDRGISIDYSDYPDGFSAQGFDASGRKVDEITTT